ncbi:MAG: EF-hand domain-containing protein [Sandaracinaceae bacterium]|nr:EF-hand domain-containing protein [Sandaracinaceae bacterium]
MWWQPSPEKRFRRDKYADYFQCLDRNDNGVLDRSDFGAYAGAIAEILRLDAEDPSLSRLHEATRALWSTLAGTMDEDGDGVIRLEELVGALATAELEMTKSGAIPAWAADFVMAAFRVLDVDGDGTISLQEYAAYLEAMGSEADAEEVFALLDGDGDGVLSLQEVEEHFRDWLAAGTAAAPGNRLLTGRTPRD